jgi:tetratricopeptide (TPR) repeat protein
MRLFKILLIIVFAFLSISKSFAINLDSLKKVVLIQKDSIQVESYFTLFKYYFKKDHQPDSMIKYAQLSYGSAEKYKLMPRMIKSKRAIGLSLIEARKIELAMHALNEGLLMAEKAKNSKEVIEINNLLGYLYGKENELDKSAFYYLNSAKEYEKLKDWANLAFTYKNVVVIFTLQDQFEKIFFYTKKALVLIPKINPKTDAETIVSIYSNAAQHYFYVAEKQASNSKLLIDTALVFADSCLKTGLRYNVTNGLADAYYVLSHGFRVKKDFKKSIDYLNNALGYKSSIPDRTIFNIYSSIGKAYFEMGNYKLAENYIDTCKSLTTSKELDAPFNIAEFEYTLYKKMGDNAKALLAIETLMKEQKKLQDNERNKAINNLEVKYQTELKESEIARLGQQAEISGLRIRSLIGIVSTIALLLLVILFFYRQSTVKNKLKTIETELRLNRARMDPHFFFNALTSIQALSEDNANKERVPNLISKFSKVIRQSLESTYDEMVSIENEIDFIQNYLELQKTRYPDKFNYEIIMADELNIHEMQMPSMLLQPFIENAIEHGFKNKQNDGILSVQFLVEKEQLKIICSDNGTGFKLDEKHKSYPSRASQIIKERLILLNKKNKSNAHFELNASNTGGVEVTVYLPVLLKEIKKA